MMLAHRLSTARFPLLAVLMVLVVFAPWPALVGAPAERIIRIEARDFAFTPGTIKVNPGERVTIELASGDYVHGLYLEGYELNLIAEPGQPATATFLADRTGTFRLRCSVACGPLHPFMGGRLQVGPPLAFWRALLLAVLAVAAGGLALRRSTQATIVDQGSP
jgi:heme/copper-type cytochrome/quinol oxidase subunit 2